jgi:putative membrane protein
MAKFLIRAVFAALGLWLADRLLRGVYINNALTLAIAAALLGVINAVVRPLVFILTLPITIVTLGLFLLVVNAMMVGLVAWLLPGMHVYGLFNGIGAAVITGLASWIGHIAVGDGRRLEGR